MRLRDYDRRYGLLKMRERGVDDVGKTRPRPPDKATMRAEAEAAFRQWSGATKLPPGNAEGADDLRAWGHRRAAGRSGVPEYRDYRLRCTVCRKVVTAHIARGADVASSRICPRCRTERRFEVLGRKRR